MNISVIYPSDGHVIPSLPFSHPRLHVLNLIWIYWLPAPHIYWMRCLQRLPVLNERDVAAYGQLKIILFSNPNFSLENLKRLGCLGEVASGVPVSKFGAEGHMAA